MVLEQITFEKLRNLFERAIRGFYRVTVKEVWHVAPTNVHKTWGHKDATAGLDACLRTQEEHPGEKCATGILLHPALDFTKTRSCTIQGDTFVFAAVNLNAPAPDIHKDLLSLLPDTAARCPSY